MVVDVLIQLEADERKKLSALSKSRNFKVSISFAAVTKYLSVRILEKVQLFCEVLLWKIWKLGLGI